MTPTSTIAGQKNPEILLLGTPPKKGSIEEVYEVLASGGHFLGFLSRFIEVSFGFFGKRQAFVPTHFSSATVLHIKTPSHKRRRGGKEAILN